MDIMTWKGRRVDEMSADEMRATISEMGRHIQSLQERSKTETERTVKWIAAASNKR